MAESLKLLAFKAFFFLAGLVPHAVRITIVTGILRVAYAIVPRLRRVSLANLEQAFPGKDPSWYRNLLSRNLRELARLFSDAVRLQRLDDRWVEKHISCPFMNRYLELLGKGKGVVIVTGHLGSFELLGHTIGIMGHPLAAIARSFKSPKLDAWWRGIREARGNTIISRQGAFKEAIALIEKGTSVAILFDQNVTIKHAIFADFFGKSAATTRTPALATIRTGAPLILASMRYTGGDNYIIEAVECDVSGITTRDDLTTDQQVLLITERLNLEFQKMIESFPEGWFWMHRRWKTRPLEVPAAPSTI